MGRRSEVSPPARRRLGGADEPNADGHPPRPGRFSRTHRATIRSCAGLGGHQPEPLALARLRHRARSTTTSALFSAGFYHKTFMWPRAFWDRVYEPVIRNAAGLGVSPTENPTPTATPAASPTSTSRSSAAALPGPRRGARRRPVLSVVIVDENARDRRHAALRARRRHRRQARLGLARRHRRRARRPAERHGDDPHHDAIGYYHQNPSASASA